jgi:hypothetical protein
MKVTYPLSRNGGIFRFLDVMMLAWGSEVLPVKVGDVAMRSTRVK